MSVSSPSQRKPASTSVLATDQEEPDDVSIDSFDEDIDVDNVEDIKLNSLHEQTQQNCHKQHESPPIPIEGKFLSFFLSFFFFFHYNALC